MFGKRRSGELYIWENLIWKNVELETCIFGKMLSWNHVYLGKFSWKKYLGLN